MLSFVKPACLEKNQAVCISPQTVDVADIPAASANRINIGLLWRQGLIRESPAFGPGRMSTEEREQGMSLFFSIDIAPRESVQRTLHPLEK